MLTKKKFSKRKWRSLAGLEIKLQSANCLGTLISPKGAFRVPKNHTDVIPATL